MPFVVLAIVFNSLYLVSFNVFAQGTKTVSLNNLMSFTVLDKEKPDYYWGLYHTKYLKKISGVWSLGVSGYADYYGYQNFLLTHEKIGKTQNHIEYDFGFSPVVRYDFSKRCNFTATYGGNGYYVMKKDSKYFSEYEPYQSFGLGWKASKKMSFYPTVQWPIYDFRSEKTKISITAYLNI